MSKDNICVYPSQCSFPACHCDQPHKTDKHQPVYPNTGVWPYISPKAGGVAGRAYNPNPFDDRYKQFGNAFTENLKVSNERVEEHAKEFADNRNTGPTNKHGCSYVDCGCNQPCTSVQTVRERFVIYVGTLHLSRDAAEKRVREVKSKIIAENDTALWYVLADDTTTVSRIVRV